MSPSPPRPSSPKPSKHACSDCGKPNAVGRARLCPTCKRKHKKASRAKAHEKHVQDAYGLKPGQYQKLYEAQGGRCAICQRAKGKSVRLPVDHDHKTGEVRGLVCHMCNRWLLGRIARDDVAVLQRAIDYLTNPPARKVLRDNETQH